MIIIILLLLLRAVLLRADQALRELVADDPGARQTLRHIHQYIFTVYTTMCIYMHIYIYIYTYTYTQLFI